MSDPWNVCEVTYADGCREVTVALAKPVIGHKKPKSSTPAGCLPCDPVETPFEDEERPGSYKKAYYEVLSDEVLAQRAARSRKEKIRRAKAQVEAIGRCNNWKYFLTLTFDPAKINSFDYAAVSSAAVKWLNALHKRYPSEYHLLVFEGHQSGRWHAHALLGGCDLRLVYSGLKKDTRVYNIPLEYDLGFATASFVRNSAAAASYISKYMEKSLGEVPPNCKSYWASRGLVRKEDVTEKWLFDTHDLRTVVDTLIGIADSVREVAVECIGQRFLYIKIFGSTAPAVAGVAPT